MRKEFDWNSFKTIRIAVHCKTEEEAKDFCEKAHKKNIRWVFDKILSKNNEWNHYKENTCYSYNRNLGFSPNGLGYCDITFYKKEDYIIIEWSDFMYKEFTKKDLQDWMLVVYRNGIVRIVTNNATILRNESGVYCTDVGVYCSNLLEKYSNCNDLDIMKVYGIPSNGNCFSFDTSERKLLWEREEVEEMTVSEIEKLLGKKIKIISEE